MADAPDWISAGANLLTGGAAAVAAWHAVRSLKAWRSEAIGRRKVEVAEEVLAGFYRVREIIFEARAPLVLAHEMEPQEGEDPKIASKAVYAVWRRVRSQWPFLMEWRSKRHTFAAVFGKANSAPYEEIDKALLEIRSAVDQLLDEQTGEVSKEHREFLVSMRRIAFRPAREEDDQITKRVDAAVDAIEKVCRPAIEESTPKR